MAITNSYSECGLSNLAGAVGNGENNDSIAIDYFIYLPVYMYQQVVNETRGVAIVGLFYTYPILRCLLIEPFLPAMELTALMVSVRLPLMK